MSAYFEKLKDPRWQKVRLQVLERAEWQCENCYGDQKTLHVHHKYYKKGLDPWDYDPSTLEALCESCHTDADEVRVRIAETSAFMCSEARWQLAAFLEMLVHLRNGSQILLLNRMLNADDQKTSP